MVVALVILTVAAFVIVEIIAIRAEGREKSLHGIPLHAVAGGGGARPFARPLPVEPPSLPAGLFLDDGHTWIRLAESGVATVGVDEFLTGLVGRIDRVELPAEGTEVERGDRLLVIRQGEREATVRAPVSGTVVSSNGQWLVERGDLARDPYGAGWVCAIQPRNLATAIRGLRIAEEARRWIGEEVARFREFLLLRRTSPALGAVSPDGGVPARGVLENVDGETWDGFVSEFLWTAPLHAPDGPTTA